jgi:DNA polymerase III subunit beta
MKLLSLARDTLLKPLQAVTGIVERRNTLPILSNVLIEIDGDKLSLLATDLEIQVSTSVRIEAKARVAAQGVTVSARKLLDILRALPDSAQIELESRDGRLYVVAGKSRFSLQTLPADDFPKLAPFESALAPITLEQRTLGGLLNRVLYAMAQQDIRYYLNGLLLETEGEALKAVATDGHRLAFASVKLPESLDKRESILPRKAVLELARQLDGGDAPVSVEFGNNQVRFRYGDIELISKVIDGRFPDYTRVIPTHYQDHFQIERTVLGGALQRAAILSNEKFRGVRWVLTANSLRVVCTNTEQEEAEEELEVDYAGAALDIGFNVTYLLDALNNVECDAVVCSLGDANSSVLITHSEDPTFRYVVMPMRI